MNGLNFLMMIFVKIQLRYRTRMYIILIIINVTLFKKLKIIVEYKYAHMKRLEHIKMVKN